jgi:hypothetical protein
LKTIAEICSLRLLAAIFLGAALIPGAPFPACAQDNSKSASTTRYLNIQTSKPLGMLFLMPVPKGRPIINGDEARSSSKRIGPAAGKITVDVPLGDEILLDANQKFIFDPTALSSLNPGDIDALIIQASAVDEKDVPRIHELVAQLGRFKNLKQLYLERSDLTDNELTLLPVLPNLEALSLFENYSVSGSCLEHLSHFPNLKYLSLFLTQIDKKNLAYLPKMKKMVALHLGVTRLKGGSLQFLADCPNVRNLWLNGNPNLTDGDMQFVAGLKNLETLDVRQCRLTDSGIAPIAACRNLKKIAISENSISFDGMMKLKNLHLDELQFSNPGFTPTQMQSLHSFAKVLVGIQPRNPRTKPDKDLLKIFAPISNSGQSKQ